MTWEGDFFFLDTYVDMMIKRFICGMLKYKHINIG